MIIAISGITLLVLLITREVAGAMDSDNGRRIASVLIVPIVSLLTLFILIIIFKAFGIAN